MTEGEKHYLHDEKQIIEGLALGDQDAQKWVYDQHSLGLFYTAKKNLQGDTDSAQDIVADAFVKFIRKPKRFDNLEALKGYLYISIRNLCRDHIRNNATRKGHLFRIQQQSSEEYYMLSQFLKADLYSELWLAINQLPEMRRKVIQARFVDGKKVKEIAQELGMPEGTITSNINRALDFLQGLLKNGDFLLLFLVSILIIKWLQTIAG
jgi:RNA polymerase sigma factor (sigma-70 family)